MVRRIHFIGMLRSMASWAKVSRELLAEMVRQGHAVSFREVAEDRYDRQIRLPTPLESRRRDDDPPDPGVLATYLSPDRYKELPEGLRVGFLNNESTLWPPSWVKEATARVRFVAVASKFEVETLSSSGFPLDRILRVTPGINSKVYAPTQRSRDRSGFTVGFVGVQAWRKGLDVLFPAFRKAFSPSDGVLLMLKLADYEDESSRPYLYTRWRDDVADLCKAGFRVQVETKFLPERKMREFYTKCDVICCPTRGDGFCLPLLEAMACQIPVIGTRWSGPSEYLNDTVGVPLTRFTLVPERKFNPWSGDGHTEALVADPDLDELIEALRWCHDNREALAERGRNASKAARQYTWAASANQFWTELEGSL